MTDTVKTPVSDEAVQKATGKTWSEWVEVLNAWGGADRTHKEIAQHLKSELDVPAWWAQSVTVGYERLIGRRTLGEEKGGTFTGSASRTFAVPVSRLWSAWTEDAQRDEWLPPGTLELRTSQEDKSARFDIAGGGILAIWFTDKGDKSSLQLQQEKLASKADAAAFRDQWRAHFASLTEYLKR